MFASNHASFFDDLVMFIVICPPINKYIHIYCNDKYYKNPFLVPLLKWGRAIPLCVQNAPRKKRVNKAAFQAALDYLQKGEPVGLFPEGHRSNDGKLQKAHSGVAKIALTAKVPIIPIGTIGTYDIWPKGSALPKLKKCTINIGKPMYFERLYGKENNKKALEQVTTKIMKQIAKLSKQKWSP